MEVVEQELAQHIQETERGQTEWTEIGWYQIKSASWADAIHPIIGVSKPQKEFGFHSMCY